MHVTLFKMKEADIISRIEKIFDIEDPVVLKIRTKQLIDEILMGDEFPTSHSFYVDFINLSFDVLYPGMQQPVDLLKKSGFNKEEFEKAGFRKLVDMVSQVNVEDAESIMKVYGEDLPSRKRRKVSWGANLTQVKEIERTVMEPEADYSSSNFVRNRGVGIQHPDTLEWIVPEKLECDEGSVKSPGLVEQERREASSIRMYNTEEHRKFSPTLSIDDGEEGDTIIVPVINLERRNKIPPFDFKKIVEDGAKNIIDMNEVLEDPRVIDALFCGDRK